MNIFGLLVGQNKQSEAVTWGSDLVDQLFLRFLKCYRLNDKFNIQKIIMRSIYRIMRISISYRDANTNHSNKDGSYQREYPLEAFNSYKSIVAISF